MKAKHRPIFLSLPDWQLLGLNIYMEAMGEPYEGKVAVGTVTLERVDHRDWDGKTLHEVVLKPWQFSWTMPEAGADYYNRGVWIAANWPEAYRRFSALRECADIAKGLLAGSIPRDPDLAAVDCCQYLNPRYAPGTKREWLAAGMRVVKCIKNHEFFSEKS